MMSTPAHHAPHFVGAAAGFAQKSAAVALVHHHQGLVLIGQVADFVELRNRAIHRKRAVGDDNAVARALGRGVLQLLFEVGHVVVQVAVALGLAQAHPVDDAGVVEGVRNNGVALIKERLKHAAVGIEGRRVEDGVLGAQKLGQPGFQFLVNVLGAADEAHRAEAVAVAVDGSLGGRNHFGMRAEAQVVIGAKVEHVAGFLGIDFGPLGRGNHALFLIKAGVFYFLQRLLKVSLKGTVHGVGNWEW